VRLLEELDADGATQAAYTLAPVGVWQPLVSHRQSGASRWYAFDVLGTTRALADGTQDVAAVFTDDAWGNVLSASDSTATAHRYVGRYGYYLDSASGLQLLTQRYYEAGVGRFVSEDPVRDGTNWVVYVRSRAIRHIDPAGTQPGHHPGGYGPNTNPWPTDPGYDPTYPPDWPLPPPTAETPAERCQRYHSNMAYSCQRDVADAARRRCNDPAQVTAVNSGPDPCGSARPDIVQECNRLFRTDPPRWLWYRCFSCAVAWWNSNARGRHCEAECRRRLCCSHEFEQQESLQEWLQDQLAACEDDPNHRAAIRPCDAGTLPTPTG
jgi:RHS repeat-associated protein